MFKENGPELNILPLVKESQLQHTITRLQRSDGSYAETDSQIVDEVIQFYEKLNGSANVDLDPMNPSVLGKGPILNEIQQKELIKPVTLEEIKLALFSISELKAPGPDGYGSGFFKDAWGIVHREIILAVTDFFSTGKLLKQVSYSKFVWRDRKSVV